MRLDADGTLPIGKNGVEDSGFVRNGGRNDDPPHAVRYMSTMRFVTIEGSYPQWNDNRCSIGAPNKRGGHGQNPYVEWTPAILQTPASNGVECKLVASLPTSLKVAGP